MASKLPTTPTPILVSVIGTICLIALACVLSLVYMSIFSIAPNEAVFGALKDATTFILGTLAGVLVNTRNLASNSEDSKPTEDPK